MTDHNDIGECGALNPGSGPLAPCTLPLGHPPVPDSHGRKWAHRNEFGDWWGDALPEGWTGVTTTAQCSVTMADGPTEHRCAYLEGHPLIWIEGSSFEHSVPNLVSWNVETTTPPAPLNALQRGLLAPLLTELAPPSPAGLRLRLFPLPGKLEPTGIGIPMRRPEFALVVDGFPNPAVRDAYKAMWEAEGEKIGATAVWCLLHHVELYDIDGAQYGA